MKPLVPIVLALYGVLFLGFQYATAADWIIVPGERVGPIRRDSSEQDLVRLFGAENVKRSAIEIGGGATESGTILFPDDSKKTLFVLWRDTTTRTSPATIMLRNKQTVWKTDKGITIGTSLKALEKLNGKSFTLFGFAWDYAGTVFDSNGGHLKEVGTQTGKGLQGRALILRLNPDSSFQGTPDYASVLGDKDFSSGNAAMQMLNPRVYELIHQFPPD